MTAMVEQNLKKSADMPPGEKIKVTPAIIGSPNLFTHPAEQILDYAGKENISLIVMATHGSSGIKRWALGSVANNVARAFESPLLLIRAYTGVPKSVHLGNMLVPLDGSKPGEATLPYIESLAAKLKSKINLFTVVEPPYHVYAYSTGMEYYGGSGIVRVPYTEEEMKPMKDIAEKYVKGVSDKLAEKGFKTEYEVRTGSPGDEIIKAEENIHPDIVVMSTHGHSGFGRWSHGSVADKVLHAGITPLLLVKPKQE
jgi:nucleotide-binding universal stress UspA family protein